mgnify:CR=1 FL=1
MNILEHIPKELVKDGKVKLPSFCKRIKIDVGLSHNAPNSQAWLEKDDELLVIGIEPNEDSIKTIKGLTKAPYKAQWVLDKHYIDKRFFMIQAALSDRNKSDIFYKVKNRVNENMEGYDMGSSSLYKPKHLEYEQSEVSIFRLDELLKLFDWESIPRIEQVKIDAQGEDFKIVKGIGSYLNKIGYITIETSTYGQYEGVTNELQVIDSLMSENNFEKCGWGDDSTYKNLRFTDADFILL